MSVRTTARTPAVIPEADSGALRFLGRYVGTLVPLVGGAAVLVLGWELLAAASVVARYPWIAAGAVVSAWVLAGASWLRCRGWRAPPVHAVTWVAHVAVLAGPAAAGWLSADGLVLWAPGVTVLATALAMVARAGRTRSGS
jgi:hypothetical protein